MPSTLTAAQLADLVEKAKLFMHLEDDDDAFHADGIAVFGASSLTTATVQVTNTTVVLVANTTTTTLTLADAANDTLSELATVIAGTSNWNATLLGKDDANSARLVRRAATSCIGQANEIVLVYENNAAFEMLLKQIVRGIETYLMRDLVSQSYTELVHLPRCGGDMLLKQPNVTGITRIMLETEDGLKVKYTGSSEHATVEVTDTSVILRSRTGATTTTTTTLFSAQATTAAMATAIGAVSGWTATSLNTRPSAFLRRRGATDTKDREVTLEVWDEWDGDYETDYDEGIVHLQDYVVWSHVTGGHARVDYTAGYSYDTSSTFLPSDIELAILEALKAVWDAGLKDSSVESERLGDYAYTLAKNTGLVRAAAQEAAGKLFTGYTRVRP